MRKTKHRGLAGVAADFLLNLIGDNLIRIPKLLAQRGLVRPQQKHALIRHKNPRTLEKK